LIVKVIVCPDVCPAGQTQRCMQCRAANDLQCDATGQFVNCRQHVS